jgi:hypothetical protein
VEGRLIDATTDAQTGAIVSLTIDGVEEISRQSSAERAPSHVRAQPLRRTIDSFDVALEPNDGSLRIEHPRHVGSLIIDPFPVSTAIPAGVRRPADREIKTSSGNVQWVSTDGDIVRTIEFGRRSISVTITSHREGPITIFPWSGFRVAELSLSMADDRVRSGRYVRGVWPPEMADFEAAVGDAHVVEAKDTQVSWSDSGSGVEVSVEGGSFASWRIEGPHLAHITGQGEVAYRYLLRETPESPIARLPQEHDAVGGDTEGPSSERVEIRGEAFHRLTRASNDMSVLVSPAGLSEWRIGRKEVLSSRLSSTRAGPLDGLRVASWFAIQADRSDPDLGAVWAKPDPRLRYGADQDGWNVRMSSRSDSLIMTANAGPPEPTERELVAYLVLPKVTGLQFWDPEIGWGTAGDVARTWRTWTRRCRVLSSSGAIEIDPLAGDSPEMLLRSGPFGAVISMFTRLSPEGGTASWRLHHTS